MSFFQRVAWLKTLEIQREFNFYMKKQPVEIVWAFDKTPCRIYFSRLWRSTDDGLGAVVLTMLMLVWERLWVVVSQHSSLQILHEPPPPPLLPSRPSSPLLSSNLSQCEPIQYYDNSEKLKKEDEEKRDLGIFTKKLYSLLLWMGVGYRGCLEVTVCNTASPTSDVPLSPVFLSSTLCSYLPLAFSQLLFFCLVFLYLNLYLLFRLLLNLSVISKQKKMNKKTPSVLKYCIAIVFNAKYYL